jgi:hypothetical protein
MNHELLFSKGDIFSAVHVQEQAVSKHIQSIPPGKIQNASEHDLVPAVLKEFTLNVPMIRDEDIYIADSGETQVDVRNDPMRLVMDKSRPCYVPATRTMTMAPRSNRLSRSNATLWCPSMTRGNGVCPKSISCNEDGEFVYFSARYGPDAEAAHTGAASGLQLRVNCPCLVCVIVYLRTTAAVQFISTNESPGRFATATVVRAGPPLGKYVLKTLFMPS